MKNIVRLCLIGVLLLGGCVLPIPSLRCLVSPIRGELSVGECPASNIKIVRRYYSYWYDERKEDYTYTDNAGRFEFSGAWKPSLVMVLHQPVINIEVLAEYQTGAPLRLFHVTKMDYSRLGELDRYVGTGEYGLANASAKHGYIELIWTIPPKEKASNQ